MEKALAGGLDKTFHRDNKGSKLFCWTPSESLLKLFSTFEISCSTCCQHGPDEQFSYTCIVPVLSSYACP